MDMKLSYPRIEEEGQAEYAESARTVGDRAEVSSQGEVPGAMHPSSGMEKVSWPLYPIVMAAGQSTRRHYRVPEAQPQQQPAPDMQAATPTQALQSIQQQPLSAKRAGTPIQPQQQPEKRQRLSLELEQQQQQQPSSSGSSSGSSGDSWACSSTQLNAGGRDETHGLTRVVADGICGMSKGGTNGAASASLQPHSSDRVDISVQLAALQRAVADVTRMVAARFAHPDGLAVELPAFRSTGTAAPAESCCTAFNTSAPGSPVRPHQGYDAYWHHQGNEELSSSCSHWSNEHTVDL